MALARPVTDFCWLARDQNENALLHELFLIRFLSRLGSSASRDNTVAASFTHSQTPRDMNRAAKTGSLEMDTERAAKVSTLIAVSLVIAHSTDVANRSARPLARPQRSLLLSVATPVA